MGESFKPGDAVHWWVGSDCYSGKVVTVTPRNVYVWATSLRKEELFTIRKDGAYRIRGHSFGRLEHGQYEYRDPSF